MTETRRRLHDALRSCRAIERYTAGFDLAAYESDDLVRDAVERRLGIIGEALHRAASLEPGLAEQIPELRQIVGLRNRVIHGYDDVNAEIVWNVVQHRLPSLQTRLVQLLGEDSQP
jgi:uncharacterized protein with HEPN domain